MSWQTFIMEVRVVNKLLAIRKRLSYIEGEVRNMKRIRLIAVMLAAFTITVSGATYTLVSATYPINVNGQKIAVTPLNLSGTTYLPLRSISEAVGVPIEWNSAKKSVEITTVDVDRLKEASVMIYAENTTVGSQGSAVCWDYGEYLTAYHTVDNGQTNVRTSAGAGLTIDRTNETLDIATLDTADNVKPVKIGDSDDVKVGDKVIVVGAPERKEDTVTFTTVKKMNEYIVISKTLNSGGSGSPLFDINGNLIGIVIASSVSASETYAIPINDIRKAF
jgi:S1-C subfamily serine protease